MEEFVKLMNAFSEADRDVTISIDGLCDAYSDAPPYPLAREDARANFIEVSGNYDVALENLVQWCRDQLSNGIPFATLQNLLRGYPQILGELE